MSRVRSIVFAVSVLAISLSVGCSGATSATDEGAPGEVSDEEALSTKITGGKFKLYKEPQPSVHPDCDEFTELELSYARGARATVSNQLAGSCEVFISPDTRQYKLRFAGTSCGSKTYTGSVTTAGARSDIMIVDHRARKCADAVPAKVMVTEWRTVPGRGLAATDYFSFDSAFINYDSFDPSKPQYANEPHDSKELGDRLRPTLEGLVYTSEADYPVRYFAHSLVPNSIYKTDYIVNDLKPTLINEIYKTDYDWKDITWKEWSPEDTISFVRGLSETHGAFATVFSELAENLRMIRIIKVGPKDGAGGLSSDGGLYTYIVVGWSKDLKLTGIYYGAVQT